MLSASLHEQAVLIADQYADSQDGIALPPEVDQTAWGDIRRNPKKVKAILAALEAGQTQTAVAKEWGINQCTVSRIAKEWMPVTELAELRAKALSAKAIESLDRACAAAERLGKHGPQATILQAAGLLKSEALAVGFSVTIGAPASAVDLGESLLSPVTFAPEPERKSDRKLLTGHTDAVASRPITGDCVNQSAADQLPKSGRGNAPEGPQPGRRGVGGQRARRKTTRADG